MKFTVLKEKPPKGYMWSRVRLTKDQTTTRPDHVWPEVWSKIGKAAQNREEQEWAVEKPKLDNARQLRGIYFIDPSDEEYQETMKIAKKKLEIPMAPAMPCKRKIQVDNYSFRKRERESLASQKGPKTKYGCTVESHESTRPRAEPSQPKHHEDHIAGKGIYIDESSQFGSQVYPNAASDKKSRCKSSSG